MTSTELDTVPQTGLWAPDRPIVQQATDVAEQLAAVIKAQRLSVGISGREHVKVEGWTLLGTLLGVHPETVWTRAVVDTDGSPWGWEARVEARTLDGRLVGTAEAMCARDENQWKKRDEYALRSMAQTRATSKALKLPLGFVMALAGFDTTPLEEMPTSDAAGPGPGAAPAGFQPPAGAQPSPSETERDGLPITREMRDKLHKLLGKLEAAKPELYNVDTVRMQLQIEYQVKTVNELTRKDARDLHEKLTARVKQYGA